MGILISDDFISTGISTLSGDTTITQNLDVDGDVRFDGTLEVHSNFSVYSTADIPNISLNKDTFPGQLIEFKESGKPWDFGLYNWRWYIKS
jgi:hypothetical protein